MNATGLASEGAAGDRASVGEPGQLVDVIFRPRYAGACDAPDWRGRSGTASARPVFCSRLEHGLMARLSHRRLAAGAAVVAAVAYGWFGAGLRPFTAPIEVVVAVPLGAMAVVAWRGGQRLGPAAALAWRQVLPWVGLVVLLVALELDGYLSSPRSTHPTLSSMTDSLINSHPTRAGIFALWLAVGWWLFAVRNRKADRSL